MIREDKVSYGDYECRALVGGEGPPELVLLHGYSFTSDVWDEVGLLARLDSSKVPFLALDMPYGMKSECSKRTRDMELNMGFLEGVLEKRGKSPGEVAFLGASLGGHVALRMAARWGARGLILIAPVGVDDPDVQKGQARLSGIPSLIIYGDRDPIVPREDMEKLRSLLGEKAQLVIYEGAGHPAYLYEKDRFTQEVLDFLRQRGIAR